MDNLHPTNHILLTILDNQSVRTSFALEELTEAVFNASPGGDCKSIREIGQHLIQLRRFQLTLLDSPLAGKVTNPEYAKSLSTLVLSLESATELVRQAISNHDPEDWYQVPDAPREGPWGEEPTIVRFVRPLNDFTNHLGAIRAIRRIMGNAAESTQ